MNILETGQSTENKWLWVIIYGIFKATIHPQGSENSVEVKVERISELKDGEMCYEVYLQAVSLVS